MNKIKEKRKSSAAINPTGDGKWKAKIISPTRIITHEREFVEYVHAKFYVEKLLGWR